MSAHDDLALIRAALEYNPNGPDIMLHAEAAALGRVEAELTRLRGYLDITRGERDEWARRNEAAEAENADLLNRLEISGALRKEAEAEVARLEETVRQHRSWADRREGMVIAYDDAGRYVGCIGAETWRVLIENPELDARALLGSTEDTAP